MLVVTVEVWPGGDIRRRRVIHTMTMSNLSQLRDVSDYSLNIDGEPYKNIEGYRRDDGAINLIQKALNEREKLGNRNE